MLWAEDLAQEGVDWWLAGLYRGYQQGLYVGWLGLLAPPLPSCVTFSQLLTPSEPRFSHL